MSVDVVENKLRRYGTRKCTLVERLGSDGPDPGLFVVDDCHAETSRRRLRAEWRVCIERDTHIGLAGAFGPDVPTGTGGELSRSDVQRFDDHANDRSDRSSNSAMWPSVRSSPFVLPTAITVLNTLMCGLQQSDSNRTVTRQWPVNTCRHRGPMTTAQPFAEDDLSLLDRLRRSEESALAAVYERYANLVFAAARRIVIDRQAAEDVTQEVFVYLWSNAAIVDQTRGGLRPFLVTVARRRAVDHVRQEESRRRRQVRAASGWQTVGCETVVPDFAEALVARDTSTRSCRSLRTALDGLPPAELAAIELAYFRGHTLREVAVATGSPEGTAKSRVRRALHRLEQHGALQSLMAG